MMIDQPLFSVLIANYNNGVYLMDAVNSVRNQTYTNWEIILVDDFSSDISQEIYKELEQDQRIHIFYNDKNYGCSFTKHRCVCLANGEFCGYLDPDDELLSNALQDTISGLLENSSNVLALSRFYYCDENMNIQAESRLLDLQELTYFERHDYQPEVFAAFRKVTYDKMGGLDVSLKAAVDQDLYFRLEEYGDLVVVDSFTYKYRANPTSLTKIPYWCLYWNFIVRHNTCLRRGLPVEDYAFADFQEFIEMVIRKNIDFVRKNIYSSRPYRLGQFLSKPFSCLKRILKNKS